MSTSPRSHASMSGVTPFLSCGGRTGEARGGRRGQASSSRPGDGGDGSRGIRGPARGGRATGGAEGTATPREGRGGDRPGTPGRRRREAPRRPLPRPRRSPRGATAASSSPPTARRGEGRSATRRSEPLRSESSTGTPASFGASRFRPGGVHRSSPRARLGRASFFESVVRPTSRRFLGPDTWAFLTRPSRVVPLDDRQRLVFVASILRRTRAPAAPGERLGAVAPAQNARAHRRTRAPREAPNAGDRPPGIARERSRARERRSRGAGSGSGVAAGVSARTIVG